MMCGYVLFHGEGVKSHWNAHFLSNDVHFIVISKSTFSTAVHIAAIYIRYTGFSVFHFRMHFCCFVTRQRYSVAVLILEHAGHLGYTIFYWFHVLGMVRGAFVAVVAWWWWWWCWYPRLERCECVVCVCVWYYCDLCLCVWRWASRSHASTLHLQRLVLLVHITRLKCLAATLNVVWRRFFRASAVINVLLSFLFPEDHTDCPQGQSLAHAHSRSYFRLLLHLRLRFGVCGFNPIILGPDAIFLMKKCLSWDVATRSEVVLLNDVPAVVEDFPDVLSVNCACEVWLKVVGFSALHSPKAVISSSAHNLVIGTNVACCCLPLRRASSLISGK